MSTIHESPHHRTDVVRTAALLAVAGLIAVLAGTVMILAGGPAGAKPPPGNNGTVNIVGVLDDLPQNQPHVPCTFSLEWLGFDGGATSTVAFTLQPPTADGTLAVSGAATVTLSPSGQAVQPYTLAFTGTPHPEQGHHVELVVTTTGSQGNDTKSKVFWVGPCVIEPTPTPTPTVEPTPTPTPTVEPTPTPTPTVEPTPTPTPTVEPTPTPTPTVIPPVNPTPTETAAPPTTTDPGSEEVAVPSVVDAGLIGHSTTQVWGAGLVGAGLVALVLSAASFLRSRRS